MLGAGLHLNTFREEKKTHETATPDTILWLKEGFGEKVDFGDWNRSHEIGYLEGELRGGGIPSWRHSKPRGEISLVRGRS